MPVAPQSIPDVEGFVRSLLRNVPGAVYRCDIDEAFTMRLLGDEMERIAGYPARDFIANAHRTFESIIHPDDRAGVHRDVHEAIAADEPYALEYRIVTAAGEVRWILDRGLRACDAAGRGCLDGIIFDITMRRLAEEARLRSEAAAARAVELEASRARIVAAADEARRRIERDLHDSAQQRLVALRIHLSVAGERVERADERAMLERLGTEVQDAIDDLRTVAHGIYPQVLAEGGVGAALTEVARRAPLRVRVRDGWSARRSEAIEATVYFCCLECLQNTAKHGGPGVSATVRLSERPGRVGFVVEDDGPGFDAALVSSGAGLANLRDRVTAIGGTLEIDSFPGRGTRVSGELPDGAA
jgi:PAS domain S-box-containing protein